jgi:hypothetical protein
MTEQADQPEVAALEAAAERCLQRVDADPADRRSAAAAQRLHALAQDLRELAGSPLFAEYHAICGWLDEFEGTADFQYLAHEYRNGIGTAHDPADGEAYLRALIALARQTFGAP